MNDWKKVFDLEILARQARYNPTKYDEYIAAANPDMILWLIGEWCKCQIALTDVEKELRLERRHAQKMFRINKPPHGQDTNNDDYFNWLSKRLIELGMCPYKECNNCIAFLNDKCTKIAIEDFREAARAAAKDESGDEQVSERSFQVKDIRELLAEISRLKEKRPERLLADDDVAYIRKALNDSKQLFEYYFEIGGSKQIKLPGKYGYSIIDMALGIPPLTVGQAISYLETLKSIIEYRDKLMETPLFGGLDGRKWLPGKN